MANKKYEKRYIERKTIDLYCESGISFARLTEMVNSEIQTIRNHLGVDISTNDVILDITSYYEEVEAYIRFTSIETDQEFNDRIENEKKQVEKRKQAELKRKAKALEKLKKTEQEEKLLYEILKQKYG